MTPSRRYLQEDLIAAVANNDLVAVRMALALGADPSKPGRILVGELTPYEMPIELARRLGLSVIGKVLNEAGAAR